jgi:hypothetical protein
MSRWRLGEKEKAEAALQQLEAAMKLPASAADPEAVAFQQEAQELLGRRAEPADAQTAWVDLKSQLENCIATG